MMLRVDPRPCIVCVYCGKTRKELRGDTYLHRHVFQWYRPQAETP